MVHRHLSCARSVFGSAISEPVCVCVCVCVCAVRFECISRLIKVIDHHNAWWKPETNSQNVSGIIMLIVRRMGIMMPETF